MPRLVALDWYDKFREEVLLAFSNKVYLTVRPRHIKIWCRTPTRVKNKRERVIDENHTKFIKQKKCNISSHVF
jgi:hypothetical protein